MLSTIWVNVVTQVVAPQSHYEVTYILTIHISDHKVFCLMHFKTVALIGRYQDSGLETHLLSLAEMLQSAGCTVIIEEETARYMSFPGFQQLSYQDMGHIIDLAVIVGGDGTMLGAARALAHFNVPLIGINHGRLGFITDIPLQQASTALKSVLAGHYVSEERTMLEGRVVREGKTLFSSIALNDIVINRAGRSGMIELRVELNDVFMHRQRADGMRSEERRVGKKGRGGRGRWCV